LGISLATLSLLIPAWNESQTISSAVLDNQNYLATLRNKELISGYEIVVLNDGSDDQTPEILEQLRTEIPELRIISNEQPTGIYQAFNMLYESAQMEWVLLIPGDYQWPVSATKILLETFLDTGSKNGVMGIRVEKKLVYKNSRLLVSKLLGKFADWILETKHSDPGSIKILPNSTLGKGYLSKSVLIEIERLNQAKTVTNDVILQVAVPWQPRTGGIASGVSRKTLQPILRDICILSLCKLKGDFSSKSLSVS
jgi:glycosyltransferase involved in cell wall biosynthesis